MTSWLSAYLLTCAVEIPAILLAAWALSWSVRLRPLLLIGWVLQFTHPVLWLVSPSTVDALLGAEMVIVLVEGAALGQWASHRPELENHPVRCAAMAVSMAANAASVLVGLAVPQVVR